MAKSTGPLFSLGASGKLGEHLIYQNPKARNVVKKYASPKDPHSPGQLSQRVLFHSIANFWRDELDTSDYPVIMYGSGESSANGLYLFQAWAGLRPYYKMGAKFTAYQNLRWNVIDGDAGYAVLYDYITADIFPPAGLWQIDNGDAPAISCYKIPAISVKNAWNRLKSLDPKKRSGWQIFSANMLKVGSMDPDASIVTSSPIPQLTCVSFATARLSDLGTPTETGDFYLAVSTTEDTVYPTLKASAPSNEPHFDLTGIAEIGDTVFVQVFKKSSNNKFYPRSGLYVCLLFV